MSGFNENKIYEIEGNWLTMQCAKPYHAARYPSLETAKKIAEAERSGRIPNELFPRIFLQVGSDKNSSARRWRKIGVRAKMHLQKTNGGGHQNAMWTRKIKRRKINGFER